MKATQLKNIWRMPLVGIGAGMMLAGTAGAQSSVTLYRIVDSGVTYTNNQQGHSAWQATAGNGRQRVRAALIAAAGYTFTQVSQGDASGHYHQASAGLQYLLSKRTDVYVNGLYQKASSRIGHAWIDGIAAPSSTTSQLAFVADLRQKF
jgi:predicted porin|nr:hypothetical protein [Paraburkholderia polaris]